MSKRKFTNYEMVEEEAKLTAAVDTFSGAMKLRLTEKMKDGKRGWTDPKYAEDIAFDLRADSTFVWATGEQHMTMELLVDIANRAMMLWQMKRRGIV